VKFITFYVIKTGFLIVKIKTPTISKKDLKIINKKRLKHSSGKIRLRLNLSWLTTICKIATEIELIPGASLRSEFNYIKM